MEGVGKGGAAFLVLFLAQLICCDLKDQVRLGMHWRETGDYYGPTHVPDGTFVAERFTPACAACRFALSAVPFAVVISAIVYAVFW